LLFAETPKSKIHSPVVGGFSQSNVLFYIYCSWAFSVAASAADWFFIAALSAAMKKETLLDVLCVLSEAGGDVLLTHIHT
jgi:hypothetical protein